MRESALFVRCTNRASVVAADVSSEPDGELLTVSDQYLIAVGRSLSEPILRQLLERPLHLPGLQQLQCDVSTAGSRVIVGVTQDGTDDRSLETEFQLTSCGFSACVGRVICVHHP